MKNCTVLNGFLFLSGLLALSTSACNKGPDLEVEQSQIVVTVTNELIMPSYEAFALESEELRLAGEEFAETYSQENFDKLQEAWKRSFVKWKASEVFHFGPVTDQSFDLSLDFSPTRTYLIDQAIFGSDTIDQAFIEGQGAAAKGFPGLEYLLFDASSDHQAAFDSLTIGAYAERRRTYVAGITDEIHQIAVDIFDTWTNAYSAEFLESGTGFNAELGELANSMLYAVEAIKNQRIGAPLGKDAGGQANPTEAEAWRSEYSWPLLHANLDMAARVFTGADEYGFYHYLGNLDHQELADQIADLFQQILEDVDSAQDPLVLSVYTERFLMEPIYEDLSTLIRLMKSDMFSFLSITVAFSDADGD